MSSGSIKYLTAAGSLKSTLEFASTLFKRVQLSYSVQLGKGNILWRESGTRLSKLSEIEIGDIGTSGVHRKRRIESAQALQVVGWC